MEWIVSFRDGSPSKRIEALDERSALVAVYGTYRRMDVAGVRPAKSATRAKVAPKVAEVVPEPAVTTEAKEKIPPRRWPANWGFVQLALSVKDREKEQMYADLKEARERWPDAPQYRTMVAFVRHTWHELRRQLNKEPFSD